jgi:hypothetical protein
VLHDIQMRICRLVEPKHSVAVVADALGAERSRVLRMVPSEIAVLVGIG